MLTSPSPTLAAMTTRATKGYVLQVDSEVYVCFRIITLPNP